MIGTQLGHYRLTQLLGEGGMGCVYAADDLRLQRRVALKLLPDALNADPAHVERFRREARLLAAMSHPNVVTVYSVEESEGRAFITMELVQGQTLSGFVRPGGLPLNELLAIALPLTEALGAAHAHGIVHRDLKPANVMLSQDGHIKVVDFGIARSTQRMHAGQAPLTGAGLIVGTPAYMAPEQLKGEEVDQRADLFALAVLLFELATGRRPFSGHSDAERVSAILRDPPISLLTLRDDFPPALEAILERCLQKDPARRTDSAAIVLRELGELRERSTRTASSEASMSIASLAVLPLQESGPGSDDLLADGITEALIADLAQFTGLKVISRSSVMRIKHDTASTQDIAKRLGVDALIIGTVRRSGNRVRVSVELIEPTSERVLWANRFDREMEDVLRLQDEIAHAIANGIHARVGERGRSAPTPRQIDPEVYLLDLKGRAQIELRTEASFRAALTHFEQALARDPSYGPSHLGVARAYNMLVNYGLEAPLFARRQVEAAIERARDNHADRAEVLGEHGQMRWQFDLDWDGALADYERALALAPNHARLWFWRGLVLATNGQFDAGLDSLARSQALDPLSYFIPAARGWVMYFARRLPAAIACLRTVIAQSPELAPPHWLLGMTLVAAGDLAGAIETYENAMLRMGRISRLLGYLGHAHAKLGHTDDAHALLAELEQRRTRGYVPAYFPALILAGLGDRATALGELERAWSERDSMLRDLLVDASWDELRDEPRFRSLMASMRLSTLNPARSSTDEATRVSGASGASPGTR